MDHDLQEHSRSLKRKAEKHEAKALKKNKCRASKSKWTPEEDEVLTKAVMMNGEGNWKKIAQSLNDRSHLQCLHRWQKVLNPALVKGPWKEEEDLKLIELVEKFGPKDWSTIASHIQGRIGKQCRERWFNHLSPEVRKTNWTPEEDQIIIDAHRRLGNKWTAISKLLDGRPANAIKNHWNSTLLKRIQQMENNGQVYLPRRERSKYKVKQLDDSTDSEDYDQLVRDESDSQSSPESASPIQIMRPHSPLSVVPNSISINVSPSTGPISNSFSHSHYNHQHHPSSYSLSSAQVSSHQASLPSLHDPALVLFGDQVLSWDWPAASSHSSLPHMVPLGVMNVGTTGMNSFTMNHQLASSTGSCSSTGSTASASPSFDYSVGFADSDSPDFTDIYQTQQPLSGLPEFQYCLDSSRGGSSGNSYMASALDGIYSPMSMEMGTYGHASATAMNMNFLNLEMPGLCPLQLDI